MDLLILKGGTYAQLTLADNIQSEERWTPTLAVWSTLITKNGPNLEPFSMRIAKVINILGFYNNPIIKIKNVYFMKNNIHNISADGLLRGKLNQAVNEKNIQDGKVIVQRPVAPLTVKVTLDEREQMMQGAIELTKQYGRYDNHLFIDTMHIHAHDIIPLRIKKILLHFASDYSYEQYGAIVFKGLVEVDQNVIGPTPESWQEYDHKIKCEFGFISALLHGIARSVPIKQYYQRGAKEYLHSLIPEKGQENKQTGAGSEVELMIHSEDPNLYSCADYITFLYLRNEERVKSMFYSIRSHDLMKEYVDKLFKPIFKFPLDANFKPEEKIGCDKTEAILFGDTTLPFIRFDPAEQLFSVDVNQSEEALSALIPFWEDVKDLIYLEFTPSAGDAVIVNNKLCCHARGKFLAGYKINENGILVPCERRIMVRMMSTANLMSFHPYTKTLNPYIGMEKHFGQLF